jgi:DNA helicase HerA-like ATPase
MIWGGFDSSDLSRCTTLINRIQSAINTPELSPIFNPGSKKSLLEEIAHFLENPDERILVVSLEHLSFSHELREILVNAIGRFLMKVARSGFFKTKPLIIAIDEAHQFLKAKSDLVNEYTDLDSFSLIAKEGRKYGLNLCLATQRPRDIPADILSQMGNFIVHRLVNEMDRSVIEHACSTVDKTVLNKLPNLGCGESCIVGVDFRIPLLLQTKIPNSKPASSGPCYQKAWSL